MTVNSITLLQLQLRCLEGGREGKGGLGGGGGSELKLCQRDAKYDTIPPLENILLLLYI